MLFLLFIIDLASGLKFVCASLYADDPKAYAIICNLNDAAPIQTDIDFLSNWSQNDRLNFDIGECKI